MQLIECQLEHIIYQAEDEFIVGKFRALSDSGTFIGVGKLPFTFIGQEILLKGEFVEHRKYGVQFEIKDYEIITPKTLKGIENYLACPLIKGIGKVYAKRIVKYFGYQTIDIIENEPEKLLSIPGIGKERLKKIKTAWTEHKELKNIMLYLKNYDISTTYALKIYHTYGSQTMNVLTTNPYQLIRDIKGIGFKIADSIAANLGIEKNSIFRCEAGLIHVLEVALDEGHCFLLEEDLLTNAEEILELVDARELIGKALQNLVNTRQVIKEDRRIYLPPFYYAEVGVANRLKELVAKGTDLFKRAIEIDFKELQQEINMELDEQQRIALDEMIKNKVMILTGGPGTGKTTTVNALLSVLDKNELSYLLCAPTGRAAKRLSETTLREAKTIHRLLEYSPSTGTFQKNERNKLHCDFLILDEVSMVDIILMNNLLKALPSRCNFIMIGDKDQLPSVSPGNVLKDLIESNKIKVVNLTKIFRQKDGSAIVINAHRINQGKYPFPNKYDFIFSEKTNESEILKIIIDLCRDYLPKNFAYDPLTDIQVLSPLYKGELGVDNLNIKLREVLNPNNTQVSNIFPYKIGDKVMQIKNNYEKLVFNGDIGKVIGIDEEDDRLLVEYVDNIVDYTLKELDQLTLAYCVSVHKSQGCEFKCIIMPILMKHYIMLQRNLIYTAITRAKEKVFLLGSKKALMIGIKNDKIKLRNTYLSERLK